jgi:hypothetical protein
MKQVETAVRRYANHLALTVRPRRGAPQFDLFECYDEKKRLPAPSYHGVPSSARSKSTVTPS